MMERKLSLNKQFFERPTNITAKVICDSINENGNRITTLEIEYPRFILAELNTHRMLSKNSSSSRAIPIQKMIDNIEANMAVPLYWGKAKGGMQACDEIDEDDKWWYKEKWKFAFDEATFRVKQMSDLVDDKKGFMPSLHKQVPNRLLEPFQMMKTVITGTEWDNFFNLRLHPDADPHICMLAYKIYQAMAASKPLALKDGEYHLPYIHVWREIDGEKPTSPVDGKIRYSEVSQPDEYGFVKILKEYSLEEAIKISAASCAAVSYRTDGMTLEKADKIFDMLIKADVIHSSPFEHLATPIQYSKPVTSSVYGDYEHVLTVDELPTVRHWREYEIPTSVPVTHKESWDLGITHKNSNGDLCSGNLVGWIQYRHTLKNNTAWKFNFDERMKMFDIES